MKNKIEYIFFIIFSYLTKILGLKLSRKFAAVVALFFYFVIPIRKKVVFENLALAFPGYSAKEIKKIALGSYKSLAITLMETLYIPYMKKEEMAGVLKCINLDLLTKKQNEKKGIILLSAHYGNWEFFVSSIALQINTPLYLLVKPQRNTYVTEFLNRARTRWNNKLIPLGTAVRQVFKVLKENQIVAIAGDQRGNPEGTRIEFFGRMSSVYSGPAVFALRSGAAIIYSICVRQPDYSYRVELTEMPFDDLPEDENKKVEEICKRYIKFLEQVIRKNPEQWLWMHKRWKY